VPRPRAALVARSPGPQRRPLSRLALPQTSLCPTISKCLAPKSVSSRRTIPIQKEIVTAFWAHQAHQAEQRRQRGEGWHEHDLVFAADNGNPINPDNLRRDYDRLVKLAEVPRIRIHDQRHTYVTLALASGANIKAISRHIGHAQSSLTLDVYAHVMPDQHRDVADKVGAILFDHKPPVEE